MQEYIILLQVDKNTTNRLNILDTELFAYLL